MGYCFSNGISNIFWLCYFLHILFFSIFNRLVRFLGHPSPSPGPSPYPQMTSLCSIASEDQMWL